MHAYLTSCAVPMETVTSCCMLVSINLTALFSKTHKRSGWQNCRLVFQGMRVEGTLVEAGEYASEGALWVNGKIHDNVIFLPADHHGSIEVHLMMSTLFETLKIHAERISSTLEGPWELEHIWNLDEMTSLRR